MHSPERYFVILRRIKLYHTQQNSHPLIIKQLKDKELNNLAKYLSFLLTPLIPNDYSTKDSFSFLDEFSSLNSSTSCHKFLISYDVENLFTNIQLTETIDL